MPDCCGSSGYERLFDATEAARALRAYERRGLNRMAGRIVDYLKSTGVEGHTVVEVGGGIGAAHVELLEAGAARAVNVELSTGYHQAADRLLRRRGLEGRVEQRMGDFTELAADLRADDVIMNRVICCYPDMPRLMTAAISVSERFLGVTYPRDRFLSRLKVRLENAFHRRRGVDFQSYVHPPAAILETARRAGLEVVFADRDAIWHGVVFEKT